MLKRTHNNGQLRQGDSGTIVCLAGWVNTRRDHGGLIFIDLRDRWGLTQLTFNPTKNKEVWTIAEELRSEFVIQVEGVVVERPPAMVNARLPTGTIEVAVTALAVLSPSKPLPFEVAGDGAVGEEIRLQYRFLDLRRPRLQKILQQRADFLTHIREYMRARDFIEVQTPILANSSPEGARDYLVPSRLHPGKFYALPQAPQQFKQLLMVAGLDKYFQIAPCFRDEDPRADRHPGEFYQLDMEMSFVEQEDVWAVLEPLMIELTEKFSDKKVVTKPFPRIPWREALTKYGSDKPDVRFENFITDVSDIVKQSGFTVFTEALKNGGVVHALRVAGGATMSRSDIDELTARAKEAGAKGLAYILLKDEPVSPIIKFLGEKIVQAIVTAVGAQSGDALFFGADDWLLVCKTLGLIRNVTAEKLGLKDLGKAAWCWIVDFPMYEWNAEAKKIDFSHNPFSMPQGGMPALATADPTEIRAYQYDLVCNGFEISSGAIRNHDPEMMYKAFGIAGYSHAEVDKKFGALIAAFAFGTPPHGGSAPGIDRLLMVLWDLPSIRDIYAFPKNGRAQDVMMSAPSTVSDQQLQDLHIRLKVKE